ncbi:MAG TPA: HNH endonuclease, partial [Thiothrix sp.]|nr:HNH endonuclease [Thiothrix sp.]
MSGQQHWILRTDISGMPLEWIHYEAAIKLHYSGQVAYTLGSLLTT